jgi:hypothetical protein
MNGLLRPHVEGQGLFRPVDSGSLSHAYSQAVASMIWQGYFGSKL